MLLQNVGLRYLATLNKLTRPTWLQNVGLRYLATLNKLTRPTWLLGYLAKVVVISIQVTLP